MLQKRYSKGKAFLIVSGLLVLGAMSACTESTTEPTTTPNPTTATSLITLNNPTGGQTYKVGDVMNIRWTAKNDPVDKVDAVDILYSKDNGANWEFLNESSVFDTSAVWGNYPWKIPDSILVDGRYVSPISPTAKIKVEQYSTGDPDKIAISNTFSVSAK